MLRELNWISGLQVTMATPSGHRGNLELCSRAVRKQYPKSPESGHGFPSLRQPVALMWKLKAGSLGVCAHTRQTGRRPSFTASSLDFSLSGLFALVWERQFRSLSNFFLKLTCSFHQSLCFPFHSLQPVYRGQFRSSGCCSGDWFVPRL